MKHLLLSAAVAAMMLTACSGNDGMSLTGNIKGAENQTIVLEQMGISQTVVCDSVKTDARGGFVLKGGVITEPTFFRATLKDGKTIVFLADSAQHVSVVADNAAADWYESIDFQNSVESNDLQDVISKSVAIQKELNTLTANASTMTAPAVAAKRAELINMVEDYKSYVNQYIFENPRSFVSLYALFQTINNAPVFDVMDSNDQILYATVATSLNLLYPENARVKHLCEYVLQAKAIQKQQKQNAELIGQASEVNSPDMTMPDKDGNEVTLSSLRGKIVILQFWVSEDKNCRDINRQLAKLYSKYNSKGLEIYQVSFDQSKVMWESALANDKMTWINVCDMQGANSIAARLYNVQRVPANFILSRDGSLIGKDLFGTRLDEKMQDLFK